MDRRGVLESTSLVERREGGWHTRRGPFLQVLERLTLPVERQINRLVGASQLNPFYYAGPIAVFLLVVVAVSGLYLTFFFDFGFAASYQAVARLEGQLIGRTMRGIHRYASGAAVVATLVHAYRLLFMGRFRGPRWLAWVSGVGMAFLLWLGGVTGYWLIWDQRAQLITRSFARLLHRFSPFGPSFTFTLIATAAKGQSWAFMLVLFLVHLLLFLLVALLFWLHILRLHRPVFMPQLYWQLGIGVVLVLVAALLPVEMLSHADPTRLPGQVRVDPIFLFFLPIAYRSAPGWLWGGWIAAFLVVGAVPWLLLRNAPSPSISIDQERCIGCTLCAKDCPYKAITMVPRPDKKHKLVAVEEPTRCVACGICLGSCDDGATAVGVWDAEAIWHTAWERLRRAKQEVPDREVVLVFTCERHTGQGVRRFRGERIPAAASGRQVEIISLPCTGAVLPDTLTRLLDAGAAEVRVVGCPPDDCTYREGNRWIAERLARRRRPRLKRAYANAPIATAWLPPDAFAEAVQAQRLPTIAAQNGQHPPAQRVGESMTPVLRWRHFVPAFALLALGLVLQTRLTRLPMRAYPARPAVVQIVLPDPAHPFGHWVRQTPAWLTRRPSRLVLRIDGEVRFEVPFTPDRLFAARPSPLVDEVFVSPGEHRLRMSFDGRDTSLTFFQRTVRLEPGQVLRLGWKTEAHPGGPVE